MLLALESAFLSTVLYLLYVTTSFDCSHLQVTIK